MDHDNNTQPDSPNAGRLDSNTRWSIYWLLIISSLAVVSARLWQVEAISYDQSVPFLSANDRSRWCTVRSLGDHNTYAIDLVLNDKNGRSWDSIDKVMHWGRDFQPHFYSSKPTLLPTLLTYPYLAIKNVTGWTLADNTFDVVRLILLLSQVLPLVLLFWSIGKIADCVAETEWARIFLMTLAAFGTFVTTFAITLTNHVPAVICVALAACAVVMITRGRSESWWWYFLAGLSSAFAAANELPAISFLLVCMTICLLRSATKTLFAFMPAAAIVAYGFFATNQIAHDDWQPPYAHRNDGAVVNVVQGNYGTRLNEGNVPKKLQEAILQVREDLSPTSFEDVIVIAGGWPTEPSIERRWIVFFDQKSEPLVLAQRADEFGIEIRRWDNWYEFPGSYWLRQNENKSRVDQGEPNQRDYLFHLTFGHHGVFSLSPIWLFSIVGVIALCFSRRYGLRLFGVGILAISVVVIAFYVARPIEDRNYGGMACGPRWLFWLAPLWMVAMIPVLDAISKSRVWRIVATVMLLISIASAFYAWTNPWVHPWIYELVRTG